MMKESSDVQWHHVGHLSFPNFLRELMDCSPKTGSRLTIVKIVCFEIFSSSAWVELGIHPGIRRAACEPGQAH
jgi:hypothetical protein